MKVLWIKFKETLLSTSKEVCGKDRKNKKTKQTRWSEEINEEKIDETV